MKQEQILNAIKTAIVNEKITMEEVAKRMGISKAIISRKLNGVSNLSIKDLTEICEAIDTSVERLIMDAAKVDDEYYKEVVKYMKKQGVQSFKLKDMEINFSSYALIPADQLEKTGFSLPDASKPPDDEVMFWSAE